MKVDDIIASPIVLIASPLEKNTCLFYYRQVQACSEMSRLVLRKPKHVLDSDWTVVIKQPLRARPTGILSSYAKRTISEHSRENTALKKMLKVRFSFLAVV